MVASVRFLDADAVAALGPAAAVEAITDALHGGLDPAGDGAARHPGGLRELRTGSGLPVPEQLEEVTGQHRGSEPARSSVCLLINFCTTLDKSW